jgi:YD repeat-containing protein
MTRTARPGWTAALSVASAASAALLAHGAAAETFRYDAAGRLVGVIAQSGATRAYAYDAADNLRTVTLGGAPSTPPPSTGGVTWNGATAPTGWSVTNGGLSAAFDGSGGGALNATVGVSGGEHEFSVTIRDPRTSQVGLTRREASPQDIGGDADSIGMRHDGRIYGNGFQLYADLGGAPANGDVITVRYKNGAVWFRRNGGAWNPGSGVANADPASGVGGLPAPALDAARPRLFPTVFAENDGAGGAPPVRYDANFSQWGGAVTPAPSAATWDPARLQSGWTLSADNRTASFEGFSGAVVGTPGYASGDHTFSVTVRSPQTTQIGLTRLETNPTGVDVGSTADSVGIRHDGRIYGDGFQVFGDLGGPPVEGDVITVRLKDNRVWFRRNGGAWNPGSGVANPDPATGVGGIPAPALSSAHPRLYPYAYAENDGPGGAAPVRYEANFQSW